MSNIKLSCYKHQRRVRELICLEAQDPLTAKFLFRNKRKDGINTRQVFRAIKKRHLRDIKSRDTLRFDL